MKPRASSRLARTPKPFLGFQVFVQNHVGRKGIPTAASFERWVRAALATTRPRRKQVNIVLFGVSQARALNRRDRGRDYATNVLSYPCEPLPGETSGLLGDIVICPPVVRREAKAQAKSLRDHFAHLTVHGVLHLLGYDHQNDADAERMERLEQRVLASFGIEDPYADRPQSRNR